MFIYLSKKIAIPNNTKVKCVGWNKDQGFIACGGDDGLLKVLKLETAKEGKVRGLAAQSNLSMNQTLEGHSGQIQVITWNEKHQKLTTSDQYGFIVVWMFYKGAWYEEMINNRNKSVVRGMAWNAEGLKICIVYEDGAVIVGSVDGNRIWGKELKGSRLTGVCWSPDGRLILFSTDTGEVHAYDNNGGFVSKLNIQCLGSSYGSNSQVVGLSWYAGDYGYIESNCPSLAVCYSNGCLQIMKDENDDVPVILETGISCVWCGWNHNGSILAIAGIQVISQEETNNVLHFYSPHGDHLRMLKIPGRSITSAAWEGGSLRIALAVDSFIYFANIRLDYKWCYLGNSVAYSYSKTGRPETCVVFWDTKNNESYTKHVSNLVGMASYGEYCVLAMKLEDSNTNQYTLLLCNTIGTPVDSRSTDVEPVYMAMNSSTVVVSSQDTFLLWQFRTPKSRTVGELSSSRRNGSDRKYHIDDSPTGINEPLQPSPQHHNQTNKSTTNPVCCMAVSDKALIIGRESGILQHYSLPQVMLVIRIPLTTRPHRVAINCDSTRASVINVTGVLNVINLSTTGGNNLWDSDTTPDKPLERKDVWDMKWADDNPEMLAAMEKMRLYVFRDSEPEEPVLSSGYICTFKDLEIRTVLLDEVMRSPATPSTECILDLEVKSLRDTRDLLEKVGSKEAAAFVEGNPHPRLWRLLAEASLQELDLLTAETSFVRCRDYPGIQLVKSIQALQSETLRKAEVAIYFRDYDEAESLYLKVDRKDLALNLRRKLCDWFRVSQLLKSDSSVSNDTQFQEAYNAMGEYYAQKQDWFSAKDNFEKGNNSEELLKCYCALEDYNSLEKLCDGLPDNHHLLIGIADTFAAVGMCNAAVSAYIKCGKVKEAVEICMTLSQWHKAVELAQQYKMQEIGGLLARYASHLLDTGKVGQAVELFRKAGHPLEAAKLLFQLAEKEASKHSSLLTVKQIYVLAALMVEEHQKLTLSQQKHRVGDRSLAMVGLLHDETGLSGSRVKIFDNAWRGAEAYHFIMLAHRQLYGGYVDAAMKTALYLRKYEDLLDNEDLYCVLALASCANRAFGTCSRSFVKLEALENLTPTQLQAYEELAVDIFTKHIPKDTRNNRAECTNCETMIPDWLNTCPSCGTHFAPCIATGRPLMGKVNIWSCSVCKHQASLQDVNIRQTCPLCHTNIHN